MFSEKLTQAAMRASPVLITLGLTAQRIMDSEDVVKTYPLVQGDQLKNIQEKARAMGIAGAENICFHEAPVGGTDFVVGIGTSLFPYRLAISQPSAASDFVERHELSHVKLEHKRKQTLYHVGTAACFCIPKRPVPIALVLIAGHVGFSLLSQQHEREADALACEHLDPDAISHGIQFFAQHKASQEAKNLAKQPARENNPGDQRNGANLNTGDGLDALLGVFLDAIEKLNSTHPPLAERMENLEGFRQKKIAEIRIKGFAETAQ